jgi:glucan phosphoethanolaminetransferase (alkaline phosphatase superfamily)
MTTTNAPPITVMLPQETSNTTQLFVMIITSAPMILAILHLDVSSPMSELLIVMTTTFVPLMDALMTRKNVFTLLSTVMTTILALLILAIQHLVANTHLSVLMITMHVLLILAQLNSESNIPQLFVTMETNAPLDLAM